MQLPTVTAPKISGSPIQFLKEVKVELKKVKWPGKEDVIKMTSVVIGVTIVIGLFISLFDFIFTKLAALIIK